MRIHAEFITSVARLDQLPSDNLPEIGLVGRSNVGKSSLINTLVGRQGLARTSNTPGRTQTLNYYKITPEGKAAGSFYFVDMPGYGYAAVKQSSRVKWLDLIEDYVNTRQTLCAIMQLIDLRHEPQPLDHTMAEWLHEKNHKFAVIGTKADKVPKTKVSGLIVKAAKSLQVDSGNAMAFSAETGFGRDQLWRWVIGAMSEEQVEL